MTSFAEMFARPQVAIGNRAEYLPATSETIIYIAMIGLMIRRLA
jgi:hypothetical protein